MDERQVKIASLKMFIKDLKRDAKNLDKTVRAWNIQFKQAKKRGNAQEIKEVGQALLQFQSSRNKAWKDVAQAEAELKMLERG